MREIKFNQPFRAVTRKTVRKETKDIDSLMLTAITILGDGVRAYFESIPDGVLTGIGSFRG
jgi:hypothetical protein